MKSFKKCFDKYHLSNPFNDFIWDQLWIDFKANILVHKKKIPFTKRKSRHPRISEEVKQIFELSKFKSLSY